MDVCEELDITDEEEYLEFTSSVENDNDSIVQEVEQSIILFDTWSERPPLGVFLGTKSGYIFQMESKSKMTTKWIIILILMTFEF